MVGATSSEGFLATIITIIIWKRGGVPWVRSPPVGPSRPVWRRRSRWSPDSSRPCCSISRTPAGRAVALHGRRRSLHHWTYCCQFDEDPIRHHNTHTHTDTQQFYRDHPGEPVPEENFWTLQCKGKINRGRHTDHPAACHTIRTNQCPPPPSLHIFYRPDALPAAHPTVSNHWRQQSTTRQIRK